jgi:outer membrane murein-binding lipoprotein Lpp
MPRIVVAALLVSLCLLSACAVQNQVTTIENKVAKLDKQLQTLQATVHELETQKSLDQLILDSDSVTYLTPGTEGYSVVQTDLGRMKVKLVNIQAYANGSRITFEFGNLMNVTVDGVKAKLEWGSFDEKGSPRNDSARSRDVSISESLRAGAWTSVSIVLDAVPPTELGFVRVKEVSVAGISLHSR